MTRPCCAKPIVRIIKVADVEAGVIGLDQALRDVHINAPKNEDDLRRKLLKRIREFGTYVSASRENDYMDALFREYREYVLMTHCGRTK